MHVNNTTLNMSHHIRSQSGFHQLPGAYSLAAASSFGLALNLYLFIKYIVNRHKHHEKHHWDTTLSFTMTVGQIFICCYGCLLSYLKYNDYENILSSWVCLCADVLSAIGFQASIGSLFLCAVLACHLSNDMEEIENEPPSKKHAVGQTDNPELDNQPSNAKQNDPTSHIFIIGLCIGTWIIAGILAVIPVIPIFRNPLSNQSLICNSLSLMIEHKTGWHFSLAVYIGLDGTLLLVSAGIMLFNAVAACIHRIPLAAVKRDLLIRVMIACLCWSPCVYIGYLSFSCDHPSVIVKHGVWIAAAVLISSAILSAVYAVIVDICGACSKEKYGDSNGSPPEEQDVPLAEIEHSFRREKVSIGLSTYLSDGNTFTAQEAIMMTCSITKALASMHKLGMTPKTIDVDTVMLECDLEGNIVNSKLLGMPVQPAPHEASQLFERDKEAVGKLFNHVMEYSVLNSHHRDGLDATRATTVKCRTGTKKVINTRGLSLHSAVHNPYRRFNTASEIKTFESKKMKDVQNSKLQGSIWSKKLQSFKFSSNEVGRKGGQSMKVQMLKSSSVIKRREPRGLKRSDTDILGVHVSRLSVRMLGRPESVPEKNNKRGKSRMQPRSSSDVKPSGSRSNWYDNPVFQGNIDDPESPFTPASDSTCVTDLSIGSSGKQTKNLDQQPFSSVHGFRNPGIARLKHHFYQQSLDEEDEEEQKENGKASSTPHTSSRTSPVLSNQSSLQHRRTSSQKLCLNIPQHK